MDVEFRLLDDRHVERTGATDDRRVCLWSGYPQARQRPIMPCDLVTNVGCGPPKRHDINE